MEGKITYRKLKCIVGAGIKKYTRRIKMPNCKICKHYKAKIKKNHGWCNHRNFQIWSTKKACQNFTPNAWRCLLDRLEKIRRLM